MPTEKAKKSREKQRKAKKSREKQRKAEKSREKQIKAAKSREKQRKAKKSNKKTEKNRNAEEQEEEKKYTISLGTPSTRNHRAKENPPYASYRVFPVWAMTGITPPNSDIQREREREM